MANEKKETSAPVVARISAQLDVEVIAAHGTDGPGPLPGGGSWRVVNNKWVPADAGLTEQVETTKTTEE